MAISDDDRIRTLPGIEGDVEGAQFAGYVPVTRASDHPGREDDRQLFYWLAGPEDYQNYPVLLWTNGGPGSPSFWGVFTENGPYAISDPKHDDNWPTLTPREKAWNNYANYLVIEHPLGCSLSFANADGTNAPGTPAEGSDQYYAALVNVLQKHGLLNAPLVISGESYAGTYLPLLAQRILDGGDLTNFQGMVLGDGWVDPEVQLKNDTNYALSNGLTELITPAQKNALDAAFTVYTSPFNGMTSDETSPAARQWALDYATSEATTQGHSLYGLGTAIQWLAAINLGYIDPADPPESISIPYMTNIGRLTGMDPDFSRVVRYINCDDVRAALHVPEGKPQIKGWGGSDPAWKHWNQSVSVVEIIQQVLDGNGTTRVLVLSGLNDAKDCNWFGTQDWLMNSLQSSPEVDRFRDSEPEDWHTGRNEDGPTGGTEQGTGRLRWLKVLNAGHMAVMDQPDLIFYILNRMGLSSGPAVR